MVERVDGARRRLVVLGALFVLPWTVLLGSGEFTLVFPFGLANTDPPNLTTLLAYLSFTGGFAALPAYLQAWPVSVLLYLGALASAIGGALGREDPRVTGGLLVLAGASHVGLAIGLSRAVDSLAFPVGPFLMFAVGWWLYWPLVRTTVP